jgi:hypothetical protein
MITVLVLLKVRQGENLSPFLFAVFINDLETFLDIHEAPSLQTIDNLFDEYLNILMKTFLLLYADDTLLFSETYEGMQNLRFPLDGPLYCN